MCISCFFSNSCLPYVFADIQSHLGLPMQGFFFFPQNVIYLRKGQNVKVVVPLTVTLLVCVCVCVYEVKWRNFSPHRARHLQLLYNSLVIHATLTAERRRLDIPHPFTHSCLAEMKAPPAPHSLTSQTGSVCQSHCGAHFPSVFRKKKKKIQLELKRS